MSYGFLEKMNLKNTYQRTKKGVKNAALAGLSALTLVGCAGPTRYDLEFAGKIGDEFVIFDHTNSGDIFPGHKSNVLFVIKPDGRILKYEDSFNSLEVRYFEITDATNQTTRYSYQGEEGKDVVSTATKNFNEYLNKITAIKDSLTQQRLGRIFRRK
jgi:hypothetical protein